MLHAAVTGQTGAAWLRWATTR